MRTEKTLPSTKYTHKHMWSTNTKTDRLTWLICEVHIVRWKEHIHYNVKYPSCWEKVCPLGLGLDRQYGRPSHTPRITLAWRGEIVGDDDESEASKHCKCRGGENRKGKSSNSKQHRGSGDCIRSCLPHLVVIFKPIFFVFFNAIMEIHHYNAASYKREGRNRCHVIHEAAMMPRSL